MVGILLVALFVVRLVCNNDEQIQRGELAFLAYLLLVTSLQKPTTDSNMGESLCAS